MMSEDEPFRETFYVRVLNVAARWGYFHGQIAGRAVMAAGNFVIAVSRWLRRKHVCFDCGHFFDGADPRAFIPREKAPYFHKSCPACHQLFMARKAWAVTNDCNGIFTDMLFDTRKEALAVEGLEAFDGHVVPVRVIAEPEENHWQRDMEENDREASR